MIRKQHLLGIMYFRTIMNSINTCKERITLTASYRRSASIFSPTSSGRIIESKSEACQMRKVCKYVN